MFLPLSPDFLSQLLWAEKAKILAETCSGMHEIRVYQGMPGSESSWYWGFSMAALAPPKLRAPGLGGQNSALPWAHWGRPCTTGLCPQQAQCPRPA